MAEDTKVYLPRQNVRRGKAGYKGKDIVVVERDRHGGLAIPAPKAAKADKGK